MTMDTDPLLHRAHAVETLPRSSIAASIGVIASGTIIAGRGVCQEAGSFTQIRLITGATGPTAITDFRCGVWNGRGDTKLGETANESATVTATTTVYTLALLAPVTLAQGDEVFLGLGSIGTTACLMRGATLATAFFSLPPVMSRTVAGWTTGPLPAALTSLAGAFPWMALL